MNPPPPDVLDKLGLSEQQYLELKAVEYVDAVQRARAGEWKPYFKFQWPNLVLDAFQEDAIEHIFNPAIHSVWIKGNTGCGKGAVAGMICAAWLDVWPDSLIRNTASTFQQAKDSVFKETVSWLNRMTRKPPTLDIKTDEITDHHPLRRDHTMLVANPSSDQAFAGRHAEHALFVIDEGTELPESRFDIAYTQAKKLLSMGNPRTLSGTFRNAFPHSNPDENQTIPGQYGMKRLITVDGKYTMNVRMKCMRDATAPKGGVVVCEEPGAAGDIMDNLPPDDWADAAEERGGKFFAEGKTIPKKWREFCKPIIPGQNDYGWFCGIMSHPREFNRMVFGRARFPQQDPEKQVILGSWLERCNKEHSEVFSPSDPSDPSRQRGSRYDGTKRQVKAVGIDVGYQEDLPCMVPGNEHGFIEVAVPSTRITKSENLMAWIVQVCEKRYGFDALNGGVPFAIDMDGPGKGLVDIMSAAGAWVIAVQSGSASEIDTQRYMNLRASMYGELGERLDPGGAMGNVPFAVPADTMLCDELQWAEKIAVGHDAIKFRLKPKKDIRKDKGRSPDRADAAVYCYYAIQKFCDAGFVVNQLDTSTFEPDYSWSEGLVSSNDFASTPVAVVTGKPVEYDPARLRRELRALPVLAGFSPEKYQAGLKRIAGAHPDTDEGRQAQEMLDADTAKA